MILPSYNITNVTLYNENIQIETTTELTNSLIEAKNKVISISSSSSSYNITKVTLDNEFNNNNETDEKLTKHCTTKENHYLTWEEFCQSKDVWYTLGRKPRPKDYLLYTEGQLFIKAA